MSSGMRAKDRKRNIALYAAGILLCLTLLSMHIVSGLYAKYVVADAGGDSARTATFFLKADGELMQSIEVDMIPGDSIDRYINVINESEVKMNYTLTVQNKTGNLPLKYTFKNTDTNEVYELQAKQYTVRGEINPAIAAQPDHYKLTISWQESNEELDPNLSYSGMIDTLTITISAVQID